LVRTTNRTLAAVVTGLVTGGDSYEEIMAGLPRTSKTATTMNPCCPTPTPCQGVA